MPAIEGHLPTDIVCAFRALLEFCYLVRRNIITDDALVEIEDALSRFHRYRELFKTSGAIPTFSLPRQHLLKHYVQNIRLFAAPNGLCSSITENKHIKAVKEPWRRSSRYRALGQMLLINQRLDKLSAARVDFTRWGMLTGTCLSAAMNALGESFGLYQMSRILMYITVPAQHINELDEDPVAAAATAAAAAPPPPPPPAPAPVDVAPLQISIDGDLEIDDGPTVLQAVIQLAKTPCTFSFFLIFSIVS